MLKITAALKKELDAYSEYIDGVWREQQAQQEQHLDALEAAAKGVIEARTIRIHNMYFRNCWQQVVAYEESGIRAIILCWVDSSPMKAIVIPRHESTADESGAAESTLIGQIRELTQNYTPRLETPVIYYYPTAVSASTATSAAAVSDTAAASAAPPRLELRAAVCKIMQRDDDPLMRASVAAAMLAAGYGPTMNATEPVPETKRRAISRAAHYAALAYAWAEFSTGETTRFDLGAALLKVADAIDCPYRMGRGQLKEHSEPLWA